MALALASLSDEAIRLAEIGWRRRRGSRALDRWQRDDLAEIMATDSDGRWLFPTASLAVPRQNGKGDVLQVREQYGGVTLAERMLHTAQELPTSRRAFERLEQVVEASELGDYVDGYRRTNGQEAVEFIGGGVLAYRARTGSGGRGLDDISLVVYDEAQHLKREHLSASAPTMIAAEHTQALFAGSGGLDTSEVWHDMRAEGLRIADANRSKRDRGRPMSGRIIGKGDRVLWIEYTAEVVEVDRNGNIGTTPPDPSDRSAWARANPALAEGRISEQAIADMIPILGDLFAVECLGVWLPLKTRGPARRGSKIGQEAWTAQTDRGSQIRSGLVFAVATGWDLARTAIVAGGRRADGSRHVEVVESGEGTSWVPSTLAGLCDRQRPTAIGWDSGGPTRQLRAELEAVGEAKAVPVRAVSATDYAAACEAFVKAVAAGWVWHLGDPELTRSALGCHVQGYGTAGGWVWSWRSETDPAPIVAATVADWLAASSPERRSAYENGNGITVM